MEEIDILIAEDDAVLREVYNKKFSLAGYKVRLAEDGEVALKLLQEKLPDIFILDINMPKVDGFGILEKYPRDRRTFPIILLTNYASDQSKEKGKELGADDYFVKSDMTIRSLVEMVDGLLKAKKFWKK